MRTEKILAVILFIILIFCIWLWTKEQKDTELPIANVSDTTIAGMRYVIWVEPRTGDLSVVNATIDSIKVNMFNNQLK